MLIEDLAKKYANSIPNSVLVKYYEAAIPQHKMDLSLIIEKEKSLSILQEFILKLVNESISEIKRISELLGINMMTMHQTIAELQKNNLLSVDISHLKVRLTSTGYDALNNAKMIVPEEIDQIVYMNGLTGEIYLDNLKKFSNKDVKANDFTPIIPIIEKPALKDLNVSSVKNAINNYKKRMSDKSNRLNGSLLEITKIKKSYIEYNKVNILVFMNKKEELDLRVYERTTRKQDYEEILLKMFADNIQIFEFDKKTSLDKDDDIILSDSISNKLLLEARKNTQDIIKADKEINQLKTQLEELSTHADELKDEESTIQIIELKSEIQKRESEKRQELRILSTYEHRDILINAIKTAKTQLIIVSPWIKIGGLSDNLFVFIKNALYRGVNIYIGYGISEELDSNRDLLIKLQDLSKRKTKGNLNLIALNNTHEKVLIKDNDFMVITSFNWLSFGANPKKGFRRETGVYIESIDAIKKMKIDLSNRMKMEL